MKEKIFVDTDVVLDLLAKREPFYKYAARLFTSADEQKLKIYVSSLCFGNLNYILSKQKSVSEARKILSRFKVLVNVLSVDDKIIELALNSDFVDFEDAIQYYCAIESGINIVVTRNLKDFKHATIPVLTAEDFVKNTDII
jgi:predicted nucleic acid-binding protein